MSRPYDGKGRMLPYLDTYVQGLEAELSRLREENEGLRAEQDNAGFIPWRLAQDSLDEYAVENARLREEVKHWKANAADCVAKKRGASAAASEAYHQRDTLLAALDWVRTNIKMTADEAETFAAISEIGEEA